MPMRSYLSSDYLWIGAAGFAVGWVLAKLKLATDENAGELGTWMSGVAAAFFALTAEFSNKHILVELVARASIFLIVWFTLGLIFLVGFMFGVEKGGGSKS